MDGKTFVRLIERQLLLKDISKGKFYEDCDINSAIMSGWRNGKYSPSARNVQIICNYLGIDLDTAEEQKQEDEATLSMRELLRDRQDLRILLNSAKDVPASSVYSLIAQIEKMKEENVTN